MKVERIYRLDDLRRKLDSLSDQGGYIFRGQSDATWQCLPNAFRPEERARIKSSFPVSRVDVEEWRKSDLLYETVLRETKIDLRRSMAPNSLKNYLDLIVYIMQYNYNLTVFYKDQPDLLPEKFAKMSRERGPEFWVEEKTFLYIVENDIQNIVFLTSPGGVLIKASSPNEDLTALEEGFPQHYGSSTAVLDFSNSFEVALFFALPKGKYSSESDFLVAQNPPLRYFSLYAYKELHTSEEKVTRVLMPDHSLLANERARAQKGVFVSFRTACSFYMRRGEFPSLEDCLFYYNSPKIQPCFELIKFAITCDSSVTSGIQELLQQSNISEQSLLLEQMA